MDHAVRLRVLGPVDAIGIDGTRSLGGARPTRILLALVNTESHRLSLDELADRCFDDNERPDDPVPALRTGVRRLRAAIGDDAIVTGSGSYALVLDRVALDVDEFERFVATGRSAGDPVAAVAAFRSALDLWRGEPFGEFGDLPWLASERVRLNELHVTALEGWHAAHLRNGSATEIIPSLQAAAVEHPLRDRVHAQLMEALYRADRQADALRAYQRHRDDLAAVGLIPSDELVDLEQRIAQADPGLRQPDLGRPLRGYRILDRLGEGAFSIVYRGVQPGVDRDVAIKQIRAEFANRPEFIRRFEREAHMVARLEHPYIVPLYDFWREPGSAYLVMRHLTGGSLESSLLDGSWPLERVATLVDQIGSALATAHAAGVVHRDVKPANVLLDELGNTYLTDFGIALEATDAHDPKSALSAGSPAYASPEQLRHEQVGPSADVHGLAIAVYETLTGRLPFPDEPNQTALLRRQLHDPVPPVRNSRPELPSGIDDVLQRATAKDPSARFATVEGFVEAFASAASRTGTDTPAPSRLGTHTTVVGAIERNPYKGLRPFQEADGVDFAGRDRLVDQLIQTLGDQRVLAVVGPSGSGKSSVVRAGLLPALRRGALIGSDDWFIATMTPGSRPFEDLEAALVSVAVEQPAELLDVLRDGERGIARALHRVIPRGGRLLLVVDQFEELFTQCDSEEERRRFVDGLASALRDERSPIHLVLTLRADFYDRPLRYDSFGRLVRDATVAVLPLAADELEEAIVNPAAAAGCEFEPGLVSEIVASVVDQPGALPLMQFALTELFERRVSNLFTLQAYRDIGGVTGALALSAERRYIDATPEEQEQIRRLFLQLVTLGEGTADTRRRVLRSDLVASVPAPLIDDFGAQRLLTFDRDTATRAPTVEIAHEALITEWPRLREWMVEDREAIRVHRHLGAAARVWDSGGRDHGELYRGARLELAIAWAADHDRDMSPVERDFLDTSRAVRSAEVEAQHEQLRRERRSNRRLRMLLTTAAVVAVLAVAAGVVALQQRRSAQENEATAASLADESAANEALAEQAAERAQRNEELASSEAVRASDAQAEAEQAATDAEIRRMISESARLGDVDPARSALVALAASELSGGAAETTAALHRSLARTDGWLGVMGTEVEWPWFETSDTYREMVFVDDDTLVARGVSRIDIWDVPSRARVATTLELGGDSFLTGTIAMWDGSTIFVGQGQNRTAGESQYPSPVVLLDREAELNEVARVGPGLSTKFAPSEDGSGITLLSELNDLVRLDGNFEELWRQTPDRLIRAVATASARTYVAFENELVALDGAGEQEWVVELPTVASEDGSLGGDAVAEIDQLGVSPDDRIVYALALEVGVWSFDADTGELVAFWPSVAEIQTTTETLSNLTSYSGELEVSDGYVVAGRDVFDRDTGVVVLVLPELDERPPVTALSPSGHMVAVEGSGGIEFWSLDGTQVLAEAAPLVEASTVNVSPDGQQIAWRSAKNRTSGVWQFDDDGEHGAPPGGGAMLRWSAGGVPIAFGDGVLTVGDGTDSSGGRRIDTGLVQAPHVAISDDARFLALAAGLIDGRAGEVIVYELIGGSYEVVAEMTDMVTSGSAAADQVRHVAFAPDASALALATTDGRFSMFEIDGWSPISAEWHQELGAVAGVAFSHDGGRLAVHGRDGVLHLVELATGEVVAAGDVGVPALEPPAATSMERIVFGADDRTVVVGTAEGVRIWSAETLEPMSGIMPNTGLPWGSPSGTGDVAVTAGDDVVLVWNLDVDSWPAAACKVAGRELTLDEWETFAPPDEPYRELCST